MTWKVYQLSELGDFKNGINYSSDKAGTGIPVINVKDITDHHIIDQHNLDLVDYKFRNSDLIARNGDIFFVRSSVKREGAGEVALFNCENKTNATHCGFVIRFRTTKEIDSKFLLYALKAEHTREQLRNLASGATIYNISQEALGKVKLVLPEYPIQQRIASILSAYDDLIEVNNQRIKLLEETANQIYKEWFVRMRFPGYKDVKFEKGIPEGWEIVRIDSLYKTSSGGTPSREVNEYYENGIHGWIKTGELLDSFIFETDEKITAAGLKKSSAKLFPAYTVIFAMYGNTIGQLGITTKESATNQACCALLPLTKEFDFEFIFLTLLQNRETIISFGMGAAQQNVNQDELKKFKIVKPINELAKKFKQLVNPLFLQIQTLQEQNIHLRQIRDRLLPRLISGKLQVKEATKTLKELV